MRAFEFFSVWVLSKFSISINCTSPRYTELHIIHMIHWSLFPKLEVLQNMKSPRLCNMSQSTNSVTNQHEIVFSLPLKIRSYFPLTVSGSKTLHFINTYPFWVFFGGGIDKNHYFWESQVLRNNLFMVIF